MSNKSTISVKEDCENSERGTKRLSSRRKFLAIILSICWWLGFVVVQQSR